MRHQGRGLRKATVLNLVGYVRRHCIEAPPAAWRSLSGRSFVLVVALLLGTLAIASGPLSARVAGSIVSGGAERAAAFPLTVEPGKRYLVDAAGKPFLIHGDTAWSLIAQLTREEVDLYLDDRRARAFNTILVSLIEHRFATNPPANAYDEQPFNGHPFELVAALDDLLPFRRLAEYGTRIATRFVDYGVPNEEYFDHVDWVLRRAEEKGFLVLLTPSYLGFGGGGEGWYEAMVANGPERLRAYGRYLGRRYRDFPNVLWVHGGDYNPPRKDLVKAIAKGIQEFDPRALHTAHGAPETAAIDYWKDEPWLQLNNIYTYGPVCDATVLQYLRPDPMPFFLLESAYENEHGVTERRLRTQAYQAVLCGAVGQVFGNNPIWHFDGPGLYAAPVTWQQALTSRGAQSMTHLRDLLESIPWWRLKPDVDNALLTDGFGSGQERAVAARAADRSFAILYLPSSRSVTVDLRELVGPKVIARWYDPANGQFSTVDGSPFAARGPRKFRPKPGSNSSGFDDWVLTLDSVS